MVCNCEFDTSIYPKDILLESVKEWKPYFEDISIDDSNKSFLALTMTSENKLTYHEFINYIVDKISINELN
jgi:hypothetical protein